MFAHRVVANEADIWKWFVVAAAAAPVKFTSSMIISMVVTVPAHHANRLARSSCGLSHDQAS